MTTRSDFKSFTGCLVDLAGSNSYLLASPTNSLFGRHPIKSGHGFFTGFLNQPDPLQQVNMPFRTLQQAGYTVYKDAETNRGNRIVGTRWAPTNYKWSYKPYKWPYKWVTGVITLLIGVITPFITSRGPTLLGLEYFEQHFTIKNQPKKGCEKDDKTLRREVSPKTRQELCRNWVVVVKVSPSWRKMQRDVSFASGANPDSGSGVETRISGTV